jgi:hypothetical protein
MNTFKNKELEALKIWVDWEKKTKLLRRRFPQLMPSDLKLKKGSENDLLERLQKKLNKTNSEVIQIIENTVTNKFINNLKINYHE